MWKGISFTNIGEVYKDQGDYRQAVSNGLRSLAINLAGKDTLGQLLNYVNLGDYYEKANQLDSALLYTNKAYLLALKIDDTETLGDIMLGLGDIHSRLGNDNVALPYYRKALLANQLVGNYLSLGKSYYSMAKLFKRTGHPDSVFVYTKKSYETSLKVSDKKGMFDAATMLAAFYEKSNCDSTLKYLKLSMALKDSLFNQEKVKQLQSLTINEQLRQTKIEEEAELAAKENNKNLQLAGIGGFIPLLFGVILLFSKKRVNRKIIDALGLLILLFFFQFISLVIDQYLDSLYNQGTIIKFSLKVGVAALFIPIKKILERWVKERIVHQTEVALA
jgi:tetratricopeptide (TPR) repeat protein